LPLRIRAKEILVVGTECEVDANPKDLGGRPLEARLGAGGKGREKKGERRNTKKLEKEGLHSITNSTKLERKSHAPNGQREVPERKKRDNSTAKDK